MSAYRKTLESCCGIADSASINTGNRNNPRELKKYDYKHNYGQLSP